VVNISEGSGPEDLADMADYFFISPPLSLPEVAMMGIVLVSRQEGRTGFLTIDGFSPESKAEKAGLLRDDVLLTISGLSAQDMDDVRIALLDARPGQKIAIGIERAEKEGKQKKRLQFEVELIAPTAERAHP